MLRRLRSAISLLRGNLGLMTITSGLWNFAGQMVWPFSSLYYLALGASYLDLGLLSAIWSACSVFPLIIGGYMTDRFGRKKLVVSLSFGLSLINLFLAVVPSWEYLIPIMALDGFISGLRDPAFSAIIADSTKPEVRALGFAIWNFGPVLFGMFSPYIAGRLLDEMGIVASMRLLYLILFVFSFTACLLRLFFLKETLISSGVKRMALTSIIRDGLLIVLKFPGKILTLFAVSALSYLVFGLADPFWITYATRDVIGLTAAQWGLILIIQTASKLTLTPILAYVSDRFGRVKLLISSLFISAFAPVFFTLSSSFEQTIISLMLYAVCIGVSSITLSALLTDFIPRDMRGRAAAFQGTLNQVAFMLGSIVGGYTYQNISKSYPFYLAFFSLIFASMLTFLFVEEPEVKAE
ncbi:MAG: MFS transporter [archaeon GB-1867-005]|nr:MFS transporter [Candidatus Culexmicrobium cathedralense]